MPLRITADDYGLTAGVSRAIDALAAERAVTAVSVMCHRDAHLDSAGDLARAGVATGLHLVFCEERPLAPEGRIACLLDATGRLPRTWRALFGRLARRPSLAGALLDEARAQVRRFHETGLPLRFINSHQHVHLFPPVWRALAPLLRELPDVPVRAMGRLCAAGWRDLLVSVAAVVSARLTPIDASRVTPVGIALAGHLTSVERARAVASTAAAIAERDGAMVEVVTHPGAGDDETVRRYGHWGYEWAAEDRLLRSRALGEAAAARGLTLEAA